MTLDFRTSTCPAVFLKGGTHRFMPRRTVGSGRRFPDVIHTPGGAPNGDGTGCHRLVVRPDLVMASTYGLLAGGPKSQAMFFDLAVIGRPRPILLSEGLVVADGERRKIQNRLGRGRLLIGLRPGREGAEPKKNHRPKRDRQIFFHVPPENGHPFSPQRALMSIDSTVGTRDVVDTGCPPPSHPCL